MQITGMSKITTQHKTTQMAMTMNSCQKHQTTNEEADIESNHPTVETSLPTHPRNRLAARGKPR